MAEKNVFDFVKDGIVSGLKGTGEVITATVDVVSGSLVHLIKGTGAVGGQVPIFL